MEWVEVANGWVDTYDRVYGVKLDRDKLEQYAEAYKRLGPYPYDQDPLRPGWTPTIPNSRWADPLDARRPSNIRF